MTVVYNEFEFKLSELKTKYPKEKILIQLKRFNMSESDMIPLNTFETICSEIKEISSSPEYESYYIENDDQGLTLLAFRDENDTEWEKRIIYKAYLNRIRSQASAASKKKRAENTKKRLERNRIKTLYQNFDDFYEGN